MPIDSTFPLPLLASLLRQEDHAGETGTLDNGVRWACWDEGVLLLEPADTVHSLALDVVVSCGIHGDETAPIEWLDQLLPILGQNGNGPGCRLLLVWGHPAAIRAGKRFIDYDLNRLFSVDARDAINASEAWRARLLEEYLIRFYAMGHGKRLHLDLHASIRPSLFPLFALIPGGGNPDWLIELARQSGIQAVLFQSDPAATFSAFSARHCSAAAVTFELGQARPLGQNDLSALAPLTNMLHCLLADIPAASCDRPATISVFRVSRSIIRHDESFNLHLSSELANFSLLREGELIAEDQFGPLYAAKDERVLFPNPLVAIGQRAGLLVVPIQSQCKKTKSRSVD